MIRSLEKKWKILIAILSLIVIGKLFNQSIFREKYDQNITTYFFGGLYSAPPKGCEIKRGKINFLEVLTIGQNKYYRVEIEEGVGEFSCSECEIDSTKKDGQIEENNVFVCKRTNETLRFEIDCGEFGSRPWRRTNEQIRTYNRLAHLKQLTLTRMYREKNQYFARCGVASK